MTVNELLDILKELTDEQRECEVLVRQYEDVSGLEGIAQVNSDGWENAVVLE